MNDSDEETGHIIVGEAAIHLIFNAEEVTLQSLIATLQEMAETEQDDLRVMAIYQARKWLMTFRAPGDHRPAVRAWASERKTSVESQPVLPRSMARILAGKPG